MKQIEKLERRIEQYKSLKGKRLNWLKGYIPRPQSFVRNTIPVDMWLHYARIGYTECFAELNLELYFSQALIAGAILSGDYDTAHIIAPPRYGKTFLLSGLGLLLTKNSYHTAFVAASARQTQKLMETARLHLTNGSKSIKSMLIEEEQEEVSKVEKMLSRGNSGYSRQRIAFKNGNKLETKATGDTFADSKRHNATIGDGTHVIIDEADFIDDETMTELGRREFERDDGDKLVSLSISNPRYYNHFYKAMNEPNPKKGAFVIWMDALTAIDEGNIKMTPEALLESEFAKTEESIRINLLCQYDEQGGSFFDTPFIEETEAETISTFIGLDSAFSGKDMTSICLIQLKDDNTIHIKDIADISIKDWDNATSTDEMVSKIEQIADYYNVKGIAMDVGGGSHLVVAIAKSEKLKSVAQYPITFGSAPSKRKKDLKVDSATLAQNRRAEMYLAMRSLLRDNRLSVNESLKMTLLKQMQATELDPKPNAKLRLIDKDVIKKRINKSPDELDATVLAIHALELYLLGE